MKLEQIYRLVDELAPFALSAESIERFHAYDNSGMLLDLGTDVKGALFSLDLSIAAIEEAKRRGANAIITHHPAIFEPLKRVNSADTPALLRCMQEGISVISAHLNLDYAPGGIDERLMEGLGGQEPMKIMESLTGGGYGRAYCVPPVALDEFVSRAGEIFHTQRILSYGNAPVTCVASFCGAGFSSEALAFARACGADTIVSSDGKHHLIAEAVERGQNVVLLTHYAAENYGFARFFETLKARLEIPCGYFEDERLL